MSSAMIAATAIMRKLRTVVTRNTGDFAQFGVELHNPWPDSR